MTPKEAADKMREMVAGDDVEMGHREADDLLCQILTELGYGECAKVFDDMVKWY